MKNAEYPQIKKQHCILCKESAGRAMAGERGMRGLSGALRKCVPGPLQSGKCGWQPVDGAGRLLAPRLPGGLRYTSRRVHLTAAVKFDRAVLAGVPLQLTTWMQTRHLS